MRRQPGVALSLGIVIIVCIGTGTVMAFSGEDVSLAKGLDDGFNAGVKTDVTQTYPSENVKGIGSLRLSKGNSAEHTEDNDANLVSLRTDSDTDRVDLQTTTQSVRSVCGNVEIQDTTTITEGDFEKSTGGFGVTGWFAEKRIANISDNCSFVRVKGCLSAQGDVPEARVDIQQPARLAPTLPLFSVDSGESKCTQDAWGDEYIDGNEYIVLSSSNLFSEPKDVEIKLFEDKTEQEITVDITRTNSPVAEGDTLKVTANVTNTGEGEITNEEVELSIEGLGVKDTVIILSLAEGESIEVTLEWEVKNVQGDTFDATVSTDDDSDSAEVELVEEPEILEVSQTPDVAELLSGGEVKVTAKVKNVNGGDVELTYSNVDSSGGGIEEMTPTSGENMYSATIPRRDIGSETEYHVKAKNSAGMDESETFDYFTFKKVDEVAVVYAKYSNSDEDRVPSPVNTGEDLTEDQEFKHEKINEYMADWRGSWGGVGYNFTSFDSGGDWYTVNKASFYNSIGSGTRGSSSVAKIQFMKDALKSPKIIDEGDKENIYENIGDKKSDVFDAGISISPGDPEFSDGEEIDDFSSASTKDSKSIITNENDDRYPTWIHELGHTLGHADLYKPYNPKADTYGHVGDFGMMGFGNTVDPAAPFSIVSRTEFHRLNASDRDRKEWPWIDEVKTIPGELTSFIDITIPVKSLESMNYRDIDSEIKTWKPPFDEYPRYVFGARNQDSPPSEEGVYVYWVNEPFSNETKAIELIDEAEDQEGGIEPPTSAPTLGEVGDEIEVHPSDTKAAFELVNVIEKGGYTGEVRVTDSDSDNFIVGSIKRIFYPLPVTPIGNLQAPENFTSPRIDIHAYDSEGRHVGLNYTTGEFEAEIPGVQEEDVSGPQNLFQWIGGPRSESVRFEIDSRGVEEYIQFLEDDLNVEVKDETTTFTMTLDAYGEKPTRNETTGEISNLSTVERRISIEPGETSIVSAPAEVDFEPDPLNKRSGGRWVTANVTIPNKEVGVEQVNLSTVELNGEVQAVDDEEFGFVRNPVDGETLEVRFPRDEVSEVLETGDEVRVTITGTTEDNVIITGSDKIEVIDPGRGSGGSGGGGPSGGSPGGDNSGGGPP